MSKFIECSTFQTVKIPFALKCRVNSRLKLNFSLKAATSSKENVVASAFGNDSRLLPRIRADYLGPKANGM